MSKNLREVLRRLDLMVDDLLDLRLEIVAELRESVRAIDGAEDPRPLPRPHREAPTDRLREDLHQRQRDQKQRAEERKAAARAEKELSKVGVLTEPPRQVPEDDPGETEAIREIRKELRERALELGRQAGAFK